MLLSVVLTERKNRGSDLCSNRTVDRHMLELFLSSPYEESSGCKNFFYFNDWMIAFMRQK